MTLALATAVGHVARAFAPLRPTFPEDQVAPAAAHITAPAFAEGEPACHESTLRHPRQ